MLVEMYRLMYYSFSNIELAHVSRDVDLAVQLLTYDMRLFGFNFHASDPHGEIISSST